MGVFSLWMLVAALMGDVREPSEGEQAAARIINGVEQCDQKEVAPGVFLNLRRYDGTWLVSVCNERGGCIPATGHPGGAPPAFSGASPGTINLFATKSATIIRYNRFAILPTKAGVKRYSIETISVETMPAGASTFSPQCR